MNMGSRKKTYLFLLPLLFLGSGIHLVSAESYLPLGLNGTILYDFNSHSNISTHPAIKGELQVELINFTETEDFDTEVSLNISFNPTEGDIKNLGSSNATADMEFYRSLIRLIQEYLWLMVGNWQ